MNMDDPVVCWSQVAGSDGVLEFMSRSAALQQFKQVLLLYYTLLVKGDKLDICHAAVEVEGILASVGAQVRRY